MTQKAEMSGSGNLLNFENLPQTGESVTVLVDKAGAQIERIVSTGQASPPGFWHDQEADEWVLLVAGSAGLEIEGEDVATLAPGDWMMLPARCRHRVAWTDRERPTVWLAVHWPPADKTG